MLMPVPPVPTPRDQAYYELLVKRRVAGLPPCRGCGCTDQLSCSPLGCFWVDVDLCSECDPNVTSAMLALGAALAPSHEFDRPDRDGDLGALA